MKRTTFMLLALAFASALTACGLGDSPEKAAQEWIQAFANLDGNKIAERTCVAQQANVQQAGMWTSVFNLFGQQTIGQQAKTDVSGLKFTKVNSSGNTANVRVTGQIRVAVMALSQTQDVDETWLMVQEDGKWKWCGEVGQTSAPMAQPSNAPTSRASQTVQTTRSTPLPKCNAQPEEQGLERYALQPSDVTFLVGLGARGLGDGPNCILYNAGSDFRAQMLRLGITDGLMYREYHPDGSPSNLVYTVYLFDNADDAKQALQVVVDVNNAYFNKYKPNNIKKLDASRLGDEAVGTEWDYSTSYEYMYEWRLGKVLFQIYANSMLTNFSVDDARKLADRITSRARQ